MLEAKPAVPVELANLRTEYQRHVLSEADVDREPITQFRKWLDEAIAAQVPEPNAMTLATATRVGA